MLEIECPSCTCRFVSPPGADRVNCPCCAQQISAGAALEDAWPLCRWLDRHGVGTSLAYWNAEADRPRGVADVCLASLGLLSAHGLDCSLSVKAPALGFSRDLLEEVAARSRPLGVALHFDSAGPESADATFSLTETTLGIPPAQILPFVTSRVGPHQARSKMRISQHPCPDEVAGRRRHR